MKFRYYFTFWIFCMVKIFRVRLKHNFIEISYLDIIDIESYVIFYIIFYFYNIVTIIKIFTYK